MTSAPDTIARNVTLELVRLFYNGVFYSSFASAGAAVVAYVALQTPQNLGALTVWAMAILACKLIEIVDAWHSAPRLNAAQNLRMTMAKLMILHGVDAALWSALMWVVLDDATQMQALVVIAIITGTTGGAVSLMSCLLPVMLSYFAVELLVLMPKLLTMADPGYHTLAYLTAPYVVAMLVIGWNGHTAARKSVILRFENQSLNQSLVAEAARANRAHVASVQANVAKSRFLAAASHDLRQPIHALGLFLEALGLTALTARQQPILDSAKTALAATAEMLDKLLDFSRVDAGVIKVQSAAFALQGLFDALEDEMGILADDKRIFYRTRQTDVAVHSDRALVEMILRNLISNAIRYTHTGGVLVAARRRGNLVRIEVWDSGIGIDARHQSKIFEEFYQIGNDERDRRKGFGLGLSIAARLCQSLGSRLHLRSTPNRGSLFHFSLNLADPRDVLAHGPSKERTAALGQGEGPDMANGYVLLLDDDSGVRDAMAALLAGAGIACAPCADLPQARAQLQRGLPRVIISDLRLSGDVTGIEAVNLLRDQAQTPLPALLITGDTAADRLIRAQASGLRVLHKPVHPNVLLEAIATTWRNPPAATNFPQSRDEGIDFQVK